MKNKFDSPFKLTPLPPVITRLSPLFAMVACAGKLVKFAPLIAGSVPVIFAAGKLVKFAPDPLNVVAVTTQI